MVSFWEKTKETLKQKASTISEKFGEYSKHGKLAIHKYELTKQVERIASELGGRVYTLFSEKKLNEIENDEEALNYMLKMRGLENEIKDIEDEIKNLVNEKKGN